jgi:hypothetical protein
MLSSNNSGYQAGYSNKCLWLKFHGYQAGYLQQASNQFLGNRCYSATSAYYSNLWYTSGQFATSAYGQISFKPGFQAKNAYQSNLGDPLVIAHGILFKFLWQYAG